MCPTNYRSPLAMLFLAVLGKDCPYQLKILAMVVLSTLNQESAYQLGRSTMIGAIATFSKLQEAILR